VPEGRVRCQKSFIAFLPPLPMWRGEICVVPEILLKVVLTRVMFNRL